jgi:hypothetical protein
MLDMQDYDVPMISEWNKIAVAKRFMLEFETALVVSSLIGRKEDRVVAAGEAYNLLVRDGKVSPRPRRSLRSGKREGHSSRCSTWCCAWRESISARERWSSWRAGGFDAVHPSRAAVLESIPRAQEWTASCNAVV